MLETFASLAASNRYLASKAALSARIEELRRHSATPWTDCSPARTHRLRRCGGPPFVPGANVQSLRTAGTFPNERRLSVARIRACGGCRTVHRCPARPVPGPAPWQSTSAPASRSVRLRSRRPYSARFDCEQLLQLGALPDACGEDRARNSHAHRLGCWDALSPGNRRNRPMVLAIARAFRRSRPRAPRYRDQPFRMSATVGAPSGPEGASQKGARA